MTTEDKIRTLVKYVAEASDLGLVSTESLVDSAVKDIMNLPNPAWMDTAERKPKEPTKYKDHEPDN